MKVKIIKFDDVLKRNIKYYELCKVDNVDGTWQYGYEEKSFNDLLNENREFWKGCNAEFTVPDDPDYKGPIIISPNPGESTPVHNVKNPNKTYLAVFLHKGWEHNPEKAGLFVEGTYLDKYYCKHPSTVMYYPAEMIYSRGKYWCVDFPEPFKVSKEETEDAFLIDLE